MKADEKSPVVVVEEQDHVNGGSDHSLSGSDSDGLEPLNKPAPKSWRFWATLISLAAIGFVATIDYTIVYPALPFITQQVGGGGDYVWIGNSLALANVAVLPLMSQLADIFGRRQPLLISIILFILGAGIAGGASSTAMLIAARTVQGLGSGGITIFLEIIICDLVPQRERGKYLGMMLSFTGLGSIIGPVIGGALAEENWRWVFWLNVPIAGVVWIIMFFSMTLKYPRSYTWKQKLLRVDYTGNILFIGSMCSLLFGLTSGSNSEYPWSSPSVIVPIVIGTLGWAAFHIYEASPLCKEKAVPPVLFTNRTTVVGLLLAFLSGMLIQWTTYFLPLYFQALKSASPFESGIKTLPFAAMIMPAGIAAGTILTLTGIYRPLHATGFAISALGLGLLSTMDADTSTVKWVWWQFFVAIGIGIVFPALLPAIQAPLPDKLIASSTGLFMFMRMFGLLWGASIPSIIFNAQIDANLSLVADPHVRALLTGGGAYQAAAGGALSSLPSVTAQQVIQLYTVALRPVWYAGAASAVLGFMIVFLEKHVDLRKDMSNDFNVDDGTSSEKQGHA